MSNIEEFDSYEDFEKRDDETTNGYLKGTERPTLFNCEGCWNCYDCVFCEDCINCINCENCKECSDCANCERCYMLIVSRDCDNCFNDYGLYRRTDNDCLIRTKEEFK